MSSFAIWSRDSQSGTWMSEKPAMYLTATPDSPSETVPFWARSITCAIACRTFTSENSGCAV